MRFIHAPSDFPLSSHSRHFDSRQLGANKNSGKVSDSIWLQPVPRVLCLKKNTHTQKNPSMVWLCFSNQKSQDLNSPTSGQWATCCSLNRPAPTHQQGQNVAGALPGDGGQVVLLTSPATNRATTACWSCWVALAHLVQRVDPCPKGSAV